MPGHWGGSSTSTSTSTGGSGGDYEAEQVGTPYENVYTAPTYPSSQPSKSSRHK